MRLVTLGALALPLRATTPARRGGQMRLVTLGALALSLGAAQAGAQTPPDTLRLTLEQAVQRGLDQGFAMRVARAGVLEANGQVREALSSALPQITGSVTYTRQFASIYQGIGGSDTGSSNSLSKLFQNTPF